MTYVYDRSKFTRLQDELLVLMMQTYTEDGLPAFLRGLKMIEPDAEGIATLDKAVLAALSVMTGGDTKIATPGQICEPFDVEPTDTSE